MSPAEFRRIAEIPRSPRRGDAYHIQSPDGHLSYTHYLFRFPAKFHPPVVKWALDAFGAHAESVLDPFTGSGTVQVEALVRGIPSVGIDIDPLACTMARVKTTPLPPDRLEAGIEKIQCILSSYRRSDKELEQLAGSDISEHQFEMESQGLTFPLIPNMVHWFRRYVTVDLARALWAVEQAGLECREEEFFRACLVAIIRRVSNADPAPVSGLEVTSVQARRNARRQIRVFEEFVAKTRKEIDGMRSLWSACYNGAKIATARVLCGDVLRVNKLLGEEGIRREFRLVVTSPPYCTAVEYSRRHKLEMYWLGLVDNQMEHRALAHSYIGRRRVRLDDWDDCGQFGIRELDRTLAAIRERNHIKARALTHYFWAMSRVLIQLKELMPNDGALVCAIGDSVCCGIRVATTDFLKEIASSRFAVENQFSYALRNRYMQYPLRNGTGIRREHILVLRPR